jgi:hypothetical protein
VSITYLHSRVRRMGKDLIVVELVPGSAGDPDTVEFRHKYARAPFRTIDVVDHQSEPAQLSIPLEAP